MLPFHHLITRLPALLFLVLVIHPFVPTMAQAITSSQKNAPPKNFGQTLSVEPRNLRFDAVPVGSSLVLKIKLHNHGPKAVMIHNIFTNDPGFISTASGSISIAPFGAREIGVKFQPEDTGIFKGMLQINFDVKGRNKFKIKLTGEGVQQSPITVLPAYIDTVAPKGNVVQQTLMLINNGSYDRTFRLEALTDETTAFPANIDSVVYETGFEDFNAGDIDAQKGWTSTPGWTISNANADKGLLHLRGTSTLSDAPEMNVTAPSAYDFAWYTDDEHYSTLAVRINLDHAAGAQWGISLRDTYGVLVGGISINPDRTMDISSLGPYYAGVVTRVDAAAIPSHGYFTIVFELIWGANGFNSWNSLNIYIQESKIFKGYSMGGTIGNVSLTCNPLTAGAMLDIDELKMGLGRYSPEYIKITPSIGLVPAGGSVPVNVTIDPASLEFRTYKQDIIAHINDVDSLIIPVTFDVTGEASIAIQARSVLRINRYRDYEEIYLLNMGGTEIKYQAQSDRAYATATPSSGTIAREGEVAVRIGAAVSAPGTYTDTIRITTDIQGLPIYTRPITITIDPPEEYEMSVDSSATNITNSRQASVEDGTTQNDDGVGTSDHTQLYPNPAENGAFTLQFASADGTDSVVGLTIISTTGRVTYNREEKTEKGTITFTVNESFSPGIYLVKVKKGHRIYSTRLLMR